MITEKDVQEAIAECQGVRNPNANTAIKLAALLTIQREMFNPSYSFAPAETPTIEPSGADDVGEYGDSDFLKAVAGLSSARAWAVMDEVMDTLKMVNPRVYEGFMRRLR